MIMLISSEYVIYNSTNVTLVVLYWTIHINRINDYEHLIKYNIDLYEIIIYFVLSHIVNMLGE